MMINAMQIINMPNITQNNGKCKNIIINNYSSLSQFNSLQLFLIIT